MEFGNNNNVDRLTERLNGMKMLLKALTKDNSQFLSVIIEDVEFAVRGLNRRNYLDYECFCILTINYHPFDLSCLTFFQEIL